MSRLVGRARQPCRCGTSMIGVNGVWRYVYRAVDQRGQVIDV
ncbi:DDE-type integrase/transposase/recombinase [Dactylosporangium sp. CA-152071]